MTSVSIVWFRLDLRLADNPALAAATSESDYVLPVYVYSPHEDGSWSPGAASRWWLHQSLGELDGELRKFGSRLIIRNGESVQELLSLIEEVGAGKLYCNRRYDPAGWEHDVKIFAALQSNNVKVHAFNASLLHEPHMVRTKDGNPFRVFTPFWKHFSSTIGPVLPLKKPRHIAFPERPLNSLPLNALELEPRINWVGGIKKCWSPGESGAHSRLRNFLSTGLPHYATARDQPSQDGVSMLSPHLHFGEIGPRQIWHAIQDLPSDTLLASHVDTYTKELGWREFAYHILFNFPDTMNEPLRAQFKTFPWSRDQNALKQWQRGQTGYPIVDAGMRQLWEIGWMHNRVRMIVASFLTKDLLISWVDGAKWFWDTLVDADLASNTMGWQWAAGCGADAAPYFRIFNPLLQGEKFDPAGEYVKRWVPELAKLPAEWIHKPWLAPPLVLRSANIELGLTYPNRAVDHSLARRRALEAFSQMKN